MDKSVSFLQLQTLGQITFAVTTSLTLLELHMHHILSLFAMRPNLP